MMSFLYSFFRLTILLLNVVWVDTHIDVPVDSDIDDYVEIPQAFLYEDGKMIENPKVYYRRTGVNRTFISTVNTSYVRKYTIDYEVYFEAYDVTDDVQIVFNVVDQISPIITYIPEYTINIGDEWPDFRKHLVYADNYDEVDELIIDINDTFIRENQIGTFPIYYTIRDSSNNTKTYEKMIHILDQIPPDMTLIKPIIIDVNMVINIEEFVKIADNYDLNLDINVKDEYVDYAKLGVYEITVVATDSSRNVNTKTYFISIIDQIPPILILKSYPEPINVFDEITDQLLRSYVLSLSDNYDDMNINHVNITHDIDTSRVGTYKIYYEVTDSSFNHISSVLSIQVVDQEKPSIEIIKPYIFEVFSDPSSLYDHVLIQDNYCQKDDLQITITTNYKLNIVGTYDIKIEVMDTYKNKATYQGVVEIIDTIPPNIVELTDIVITDFKEKDLSIFFKATDQYDQGDIDVHVDDRLVKYDQIGDYEITIYAYDQSQNEAVITSSVIIIDISAPHLLLTQPTFNLNVGSQEVDLYAFVSEIDDNYDLLDISDLIIESQIDYHTPGIYEINYTIKDSSLNETKKSLYLYINDFEKPYIYADPIYINMYDTVDLLEGLIVSDNVGILDVYYNPETIDTTSPGTYQITYVVMDQSGNTSQFTRTIHINEIEKSIRIEAFIPIIIVSILSVSVIYYLYKKI